MNENGTKVTKEAHQATWPHGEEDLFTLFSLYLMTNDVRRRVGHLCFEMKE
jgi:hypothetical protein